MLDQEHAALVGQLARARGECATVAERRARLAAQAERIGAAAGAARAEQDTARALKDADADLADAAYRAGFDTPEAAAALLPRPRCSGCGSARRSAAARRPPSPRN